MTSIYEINPQLFDSILQPIIRTTIEYIYLHPVKYTHVIKDLNEYSMQRIGEIFDDLIGYDDAVITNEIKDKCIKLIKNSLWDTSVIKGYSKFNISSLSTGNNDIRGGGCGYLNFTLEDFKYDVELNSDVITLKDISEAVYRMKGSKYDCGYEMFDNIKSVINKESDTISFVTVFAYGS